MRTVNQFSVVALAGAAMLVTAAPDLYGQVRFMRPSFMRPSFFNNTGTISMSRPITTTNTITTNGGTTNLVINNPSMSPFFTRAQNMAFQHQLQRRAFYAGVAAGRYGYGGYSPGYAYGYAMMASSYGLPYYTSYGNGYSLPYSSSSYTPSREYVREPYQAPPAAAQDQLDRARMNPPVGEILSAKALNDILADLRKLAIDRPDDLPDVGLPLDNEALAHINLTRNGGNIGILKKGAALTWPTAFRGAELQDLRERIVARTREALEQARAKGTVDAAVTAQLARDVDQLKNELRRSAAALSFDQHVKAKNFLKSLDEAVVALQEPNAGDYLNGKFAVKAKTFPELVKQMTAAGLKFAPATPGDEAAYTALFQSLAAYDRSLKVAKPVP